ncbi:MAG TPA: chemotaxis protein, partial [Alphaproteobacteria bacterium]|nr:chemotaxis protein [Alphaproteobacteria bacterium]
MDTGIQSVGDMAVMQSSSPQQLAKGAANVDKTSQDFESMFMSQMLQPMFDTIDVDPVFGGGHGEQVMRSFLVQEYGK